MTLCDFTICSLLFLFVPLSDVLFFLFVCFLCRRPQRNVQDFMVSVVRVLLALKIINKKIYKIMHIC